MPCSSLRDLLKNDLVGYCLTPVYWVKKEHALSATVPALRGDTKKVMLCMNRELAENVLRMMVSNSGVGVERKLALVHRETDTVILIDGGFFDEICSREAIPLTSESDFDKLITQHKAPFVWR